MSLWSLRRFGLHSQGQAKKHNHTPLQSPSTEIRLLQLLDPSEAQSSNRNSSFRVQCITKVVSFKEVPLFIALSYAWGKSSDKAPILLDGQIAYITKNLEDALIHYQRDRSISGNFSFWIDAICINQEDDHEKSKQIQIMGDIYRTAAQVNVWLGHADELCNFALESINAVHATRSLTSEEIRSRIASVEVSSDAHSRETHIQNMDQELQHLLGEWNMNDLFTAVDHLTKRPWWHRLWVIQEVALSKFAVLQCGPMSIPWESYEYFLDVCELFMICRPTDALFNSVYRVCYTSFIVSKMWRHVSTGKPTNMLHLFETMITMTTRETSDPRDRVYAFLGLAADNLEYRIVPNYSLSCAQVYTDTAESLLKQHGLMILSYCSRQQKSKTRLMDLPSWVPDLSDTALDPLRGSAVGTPNYHASGSTTPDFTLNEVNSGRLLSVQGIYFDTVYQRVSSRPNAMASYDISQVKVLQKWLKGFISSVNRFSSQKLESSSSNYLNEALWRTPIANIMSRRGQETERPARNDDKESYDAFLDGDAAHLEQNQSTALDYCYSAWLRTSGRCLFITSKGYIGLAGWDIKERDIICILPGADVPFAFRRLPNDRCSLVGETYVHGIMDGEFIKTEQKEKGFLHVI